MEGLQWRRTEGGNGRGRGQRENVRPDIKSSHAWSLCSHCYQRHHDAHQLVCQDSACPTCLVSPTPCYVPPRVCVCGTLCQQCFEHPPPLPHSPCVVVAGLHVCSDITFSSPFPPVPLLLPPRPCVCGPHMLTVL